MPVSRATARPNPRERGSSYDICPRTPDRLVVEFGDDQVNHPTCPRLKRPTIVEGFAVLASRDYFKQAITVKNQRANDPCRYRKSEGLEQHFWCDFHRDFYMSVILRKKSQPIVPMKYIDWEYFENMNDPLVNAVIEKFEYKLRDLMGFKYNWNTEIICQFYCSLYYNERDNTIHWTTEGEHYCVDYMTFSCILGLGSEHEKYKPIHVEKRIKPADVAFMFFNPILAHEGKSIHLQPCYNYANFMMRWTIDPRKGDYTTLNFYAVNLLNRMAPGGRPFNAFDFMWNELRCVMDDSRKHLPYAPYIMYMIERVTKITFPKDVVHDPLHLRPRSEVPATASRHPGSSSTAPRVDDPPLHAPSSSHHRRSGSMVKRVLHVLVLLHVEDHGSRGQ
ncbi:putative copia-like retroelement [Panicum miliaceum]|uniref:Copia-like retroelement n=1 Tax=Panicum miliaceum TaxID=4540 RepID=A0A3L6QPX6_PANMI|nr:putative copia-like retroelement [Panicum miliaceum]